MSQPPVPLEQAKDLRRWKAHNQRRWELEKDELPAEERAPFACECTSPDCCQPVSLTMLEYESAHVVPDWYAVIAGDVIPSHGTRVVVKHPHFWVVQTREQQA